MIFRGAISPPYFLEVSMAKMTEVDRLVAAILLLEANGYVVKKSRKPIIKVSVKKGSSK